MSYWAGNLNTYPGITLYLIRRLLDAGRRLLDADHHLDLGAMNVNINNLIKGQWYAQRRTSSPPRLVEKFAGSSSRILRGLLSVKSLIYWRGPLIPSFLSQGSWMVTSAL